MAQLFRLKQSKYCMEFCSWWWIW